MKKELQKKLKQISTQYKADINLSKNKSLFCDENNPIKLEHLLLMGLPVAGVMLSPVNASAQNMTQDVTDFTVEDGNALLDIDGDGQNDFRIHAVAQSMYLAPYNGNSGMVASSSSSTADLSQLGFNAGINAGNIKAVSSSGVVTDAGGLGGEFNDGSPNERGFIGVRFTISGATHFGWIQVEAFKETGAGANNQKMIVEAFGWNATPGATSTTPAGFILLPVELLRFSTSVKSDLVTLNWATASEENNAGFEVQRSTDGKTFQTLTFVEGQGTTHEQQEYNFDDKDLRSEQLYYYRLKQIDYDGQFEYSEIITAQLAGNTIKGTFAPNPTANGQTVLNYSAVDNGQLGLEVYDAAGKQMTQQTHQVLRGDNRLSLNLSDLGTGMFFVKMQQNGQSTYQKLILK